MSTFKPYNLELIKSFVDKVEANHSKDFKAFTAAKFMGIEPAAGNLAEGLTTEEILAAVRALAAVVRAGVDLKTELGIRKRPVKKRSGTRLNKTIHSPEFGVVMAYVSEEITYTEAVNKIMALCHVEKRSAESFIKEMKAAAVEVERIKQVIALATATK